MNAGPEKIEDISVSEIFGRLPFSKVNRKGSTDEIKEENSSDLDDEISDKPFGHLAHQKWSQEGGLNHTPHVSPGRAARFTYRRDDKKRREQSPGPGTGVPISSFRLPEIY